MLGPEQRLRAVDRELLDHVDVLAAAVVALARIALGVLVREHAALALEHGLRHEVLRGDHLQRALLALELVADGLGDLGVDLGERALEVVGLQGGHAVTVAQESAAVRRFTSSAACVRELTPSLRSTWLTCVRAVRSLIPSAAAISLFAWPCATRSRISRSRGVSASRSGRDVAGDEPAGGVEREQRGPGQDDPDRPVVARAFVGRERRVVAREPPGGEQRRSSRRRTPARAAAARLATALGQVGEQRIELLARARLGRGVGACRVLVAAQSTGDVVLAEACERVPRSSSLARMAPARAAQQHERASSRDAAATLGVAATVHRRAGHRQRRRAVDASTSTRSRSNSRARTVSRQRRMLGTSTQLTVSRSRCRARG